MDSSNISLDYQINNNIFQNQIPYIHPETPILCDNGEYVLACKLTNKHNVISSCDENGVQQVSKINCIIRMSTIDSIAHFVYVNNDSLQESIKLLYCSPCIPISVPISEVSFKILPTPCSHVFIIVLESHNSLITPFGYIFTPTINPYYFKDNSNYFNSKQFHYDLERFDNYSLKVMNCSYNDFKIDSNTGFIKNFISPFRSNWQQIYNKSNSYYNILF